MAQYTIDELARAAETTVRNIRAYRAKQLLPAPERVGRANVYSDVHLARLRMIGRLLGRGFTLANIAEMLRAFDRGEGVGELLGLESALMSPWSNELPSYVSYGELGDMFGPELEPTDLEQAEKLGLLRRERERVMVPSPRLLHVGAELVKAGIPLKVVLNQLAQLRTDVERIAGRFVQLIVDEVFGRWGEDTLPPASEFPWLAEFIHRVRPMAQTVVDVELARALENSINAAMGHRLARIAEAGGKPNPGGRTAPPSGAEGGES